MPGRSPRNRGREEVWGQMTKQAHVVAVGASEVLLGKAASSRTALFSCFLRPCSLEVWLPEGSRRKMGYNSHLFHPHPVLITSHINGSGGGGQSGAGGPKGNREGLSVCARRSGQRPKETGDQRRQGRLWGW